MARGIRKARAVSVTVALVLAAAGLARAEAFKVRAAVYVGEPFGVACVEVDLPASEAPEPLGWRGLGIDEKQRRALYPAVDSQSFAGIAKKVLRDSRRPAARLLGEVIEDRGKAKIYFLFSGQEPLDLSIQSRIPHALSVTPVSDREGWKRLRDAWWRRYNAGHGSFLARPSYPPLAANYLRAMLAGRLGLEVAERARGRSWQEELVRELSLLAGSESLRLEVQRERFSQAADNGPADQPMPAPIQTEPSPLPEPLAAATVERLALRVPAECLYIRFGSFANFLWFQDALARIGGDFENLVASRGVDAMARERFEMQLACQTSVLSRLFGDAVVSDVAIVGTDLFLKEGGAYGLLFKARSSALLSKDLADQRAQWRQKVPGTAETRVKIGDREVSLLSSPDGRVRSHYVADGDYHFVTTSKTLVRRFLEVRSGKGSLGESRGFRHARSVMPTARNDTVFVCLPIAFYRNLLSPHYRVEMMRRLEATADIDLVQMALLAAAAEGKVGGSIEELVAGGFLPAGFGPRPDGSRTLLAGNDVRDSLRGRKGAFVPIPDIETARVTRAEAAAYQQLAELHRSPWAEVAPAFVGIQRRSLQQDRDRITIDLRTTPLTKDGIEMVRRFVGTADKRRVTPLADSAVTFEVVRPEHRVFGGLERVGPGLEVLDGIVVPLGRLRNLLIGYLGTTGEAGLLALLPFRALGPPDADGYTQGEHGLWRRTVEPFYVYSFQRDVLQRVTPQLRLEDAEREAQLRVHLRDLSNSPLAPLLNAWGYARTRRTALGNIEFMHQMVQQFHVPGDAAKATAEVLLAAKLVCPLGGQHVFRQPPQGVAYWTSTGLEGARGEFPPASRMPEGYQAPPLNWFRGLDADAAVTDTGLAAHAELEMQWPTAVKNRTQRP